MKLKNDYIFLKSKRCSSESSTEDTQGKPFEFEKNVDDFLKSTFETEQIQKDPESKLINKYVCPIEVNEKIFLSKIEVRNSRKYSYLNIEIEGNTKKQIVIALEQFQKTFLSSGIRNYYIEIISYDSVSKYYCDQIYPQLNEVERNLRCLLYNIYILEFGEEYYQVTMDDSLQKKIKRVIANNEQDLINEICNTYHINKSKANEIIRFQYFFDSLEWGDIQELLFDTNWTPIEENEKKVFLEQNTNLTYLSDSELREAFEKFSPQSDWERFFKDKIIIG